MKKQENLATEILHSAMKKQGILTMAFVVSLVVNVVLLAMFLLEIKCESR